MPVKILASPRSQCDIQSYFIYFILKYIEKALLPFLLFVFLHSVYNISNSNFSKWFLFSCSSQSYFSTFISWLGLQSAERCRIAPFSISKSLLILCPHLVHTCCYATFCLWDTTSSTSPLVSLCCKLVLDPCLIYQTLYTFIFKDFFSIA